jgi:hypothetical protein
MRDFQEEFDESQEDDYELFLEIMLNGSRAAHESTLRVYATLNRKYNSLIRHLEVMVDLTEMAMKEVEE